MVVVLVLCYVVFAVGYCIGVEMVDAAARGVMPTRGRILAMVLLTLIFLPLLLGFSTGAIHAREVRAFIDRYLAWRTTQKEDEDA